MSQNNSTNINWIQEAERNKKQVAKRIRQIYTCLGRLSSPDNAASVEIPAEAAIEIQHAFAHLALRISTPSKKQIAQRWHQALAHLNRALIDFLKIFTLELFPQYRTSTDFMEKWLKTRQKEYIEHASGTQSPNGVSTTDINLLTIENYEKILNINLNHSTLHFTEEHLSGDLWQKYLLELDNWMNSDLMLGGVIGEKDVGKLDQLLDTLWSLNVDLLANYNLQTQIQTLEEISNLGKANKWGGNLWADIDNLLSQPSLCTKNNVIPLYRRFLEYFRVSPWTAIRAKK